jgi:hypothetical protein
VLLRGATYKGSSLRDADRRGTFLVYAQQLSDVSLHCTEGGDQDVGDRGRLVAVGVKPPRSVVDHHGEPPGSSWPLRCERAWECGGVAGWERSWAMSEGPCAMSEGSRTWLIARCWRPSWIQRALQLVCRWRPGTDQR